MFTSLQPNFDSVQNFSCYRYKLFSEIININWIEVHVDLEEDTKQPVMKKHMTLLLQLQSKLWQVVVKTTLLMVLSLVFHFYEKNVLDSYPWYD